MAPALDIFAYEADYSNETLNKSINKGLWKPSIHMPKVAARIYRKVTDVRIERVQDISEDGAIKEGFEDVPEVFSAKELFQATWNSICKNWNENPWVW